MGIPIFPGKTWDSFRGGRFTRNNLVKISDDHVLVAANVIFPGDGVAHVRPGYTLVVAGLGFSPTRMFDYQRQSDQKQFVFVTGQGHFGYIDLTTKTYHELSSAEDPNAVFDFATSVFACYASNGKKAYKLVDVAGTLTKWQWGISAPAVAPTIAVGAGTLTLTFGRQYCFSYVSKWTDSTGVQRVHVGPPSPLSAHTGPFTSGVVTVGAIAASVDPQVTHIWVWSTVDTPLDTTSVFQFAAEITNGTTSWGDTQADTALDTTRSAPFDNLPVPPAGVLLEYQQRIGLMGISGKPDLVQATGLEECPLGIPQECAPLTLFFNVPGGIKALSGGCIFDQSLMLSTPQFWFQIQGFSAETFTERDKIFDRGSAGAKCIATSNTWMAWLGPDKKIWAWPGQGEPIEVSWKIARSDGSGQLSMESIYAPQIGNAELHFYSFGRYSVLVCLVATKNSNVFDWMQIWDTSAMNGPAGPFGAMTKDGNLIGTAESDGFLNDPIVTAANVLVNDTPYLFLADANGNVYQWPDGLTDNGQPIIPVMGSEFSDLDMPEVQKRMHWAITKTSRQDAVAAFKMAAVVSDGVNINQKPTALPMEPLPAQYGVDPTCARAKMQSQAGTSIGRMMRWFLFFPTDGNAADVYSVRVEATPLGDVEQ